MLSRLNFSTSVGVAAGAEAFANSVASGVEGVLVRTADV